MDLSPSSFREKGQPATVPAAVLDVGMSKTVCLIGVPNDDQGAELRGVGVQSPQRGADGAPLDFDAAARAIRIAVDQAERMACETISAVTLGYSGPGLRAQHVGASVALKGKPVSAHSVRAALAAALRVAPLEGRVVLHAIPFGYRVDEGALVPDPRDLEGGRLAAEVCIVTAPLRSIEALRGCVAAAGLGVSRVGASPYAAGLACLSDDEREKGAVLIDLGAATSGVVAFFQGNLVLCDAVPIGAAAMSEDVAARMATTFAAADRAKILYGGFGRSPSEAEAEVEIPHLGPEGRLEPAYVSRSLLNETLAARLEEIFNRLRGKLAPLAPLEGRQPWRAAFVGGGSELSGLNEFAAAALARPVRLARPIGFGTLECGAAAAMLAGAAGLLRLHAQPFWMDSGAAPGAPNRHHPGLTGNPMGKAWSWLRDNF